MFRRTAFLLVVGVFIFAPFSASAANVNFFGPIVDERCRCDAETTGFEVEINGEMVPIDSAPNWACVLVTIQNAVAVGISFILLMITLIIAYSGLMIIVQPDKPGHREEGKSMMMNAVLGLVIVLTAWLIVDFVMKALYNQTEAAATLGRAPDLAWNSIFSDDLDPANLCFAPRTVEPGTDDGGGLNDPDTTPGSADAPPSNADQVPSPQTPVSSTATPVAPSNFFVTGTGVSYIELSWAPAVTGVEKYQLDYTSTTKPGTQAGSEVADDSTYKHLQSFGAGAPGYAVHGGLQPNTRYFYRLWAINGESPNWKYAKAVATGMTQSNTSSAPTAPTKVAVPGTPTGLTATAVGTTQVNVSWTPTSGATEYQLDLATGSGGEYAFVAKVSGGTTKTYTYTVKTPGTTHHFALWAKNSSGFSKKAATVSVSVGGGTTTSSPNGCTDCVKVNGPYLSKTHQQNGCNVSGGIDDGVPTFNPKLDSCYVNRALDEKLEFLVHPNLGFPAYKWWVTEMWPPTLNHTTPTHCHAKGTCVDASFKESSDYNLDTIKQFMDAAKAAGLRPVFEEDHNGDKDANCALSSAVASAGYETACLNIVGDHFSLYLN